MTQFPWKTSAEPTRRRLSWDCRGSGPRPGLLRRLAAKGEGLPEHRGHPGGGRGTLALVTLAGPPDPAEPEGEAAPRTLHSQR